MADIQGRTQWQPWGGQILVSGGSDTLLTDFGPSSLDFSTGKIIGVYPSSYLILRAFGIGTAGSAITIRVSGWMDPAKSGGTGPGNVLFRLTGTLGSRTFTGPPFPGGSSGSWRFVQNWSRNTQDFVNVRVDAFVEATATGTDHDHDSIVFPTLGYSYLLLELVSLTGTEYSIVYRPLTMGDSVLNTLNEMGGTKL